MKDKQECLIQHSTLNIQHFKLFLFLSIIQCDITSFAGSDSYGIQYRNHEDSAISHFTRLCSSLDGSDGWLHILITNHNIQKYTFDAAGIVHHTTINASLAHLSLTSYIIIREPLDVGSQKCLLDILESRLADNCLNLLHNPLIINNVLILLLIVTLFLLIVTFSKRTFIGCYANQAFLLHIVRFGCKITTFCQYIEISENILIVFLAFCFNFSYHYLFSLHIVMFNSRSALQFVSFRLKFKVSRSNFNSSRLKFKV